MSPPRSTPGTNRNCVPVELISIRVPFVIESSSRKNDASWSCSPGFEISSGRIFKISNGRCDNNDTARRCRNCTAPSSNRSVLDDDDEGFFMVYCVLMVDISAFDYDYDV